MARGRGGSQAGRCNHVVCEVARTLDGQAFYAKCLACGKTGPRMLTSPAARRALLPNTGENVDDEEEGE